MDGASVKVPFDDHCGLFETLLDIPGLYPEVLRQIGGPGRCFAKRGCSQVIVKDRCLIPQRLAAIEHWRKYLVPDVDQFQRLFGSMWTCGGYGGHGMTLIQDLVACQDVVPQVLGRIEALVPVREIGHVPACRRWKIGSSNNGMDPWKGLSPGGVNREDACVSMRAPEHLAVEHPGDLQVGSVESAARDLVCPVVTYRPRAYDTQLIIR